MEAVDEAQPHLKCVPVVGFIIPGLVPGILPRFVRKLIGTVADKLVTKLVDRVLGAAFAALGRATRPREEEAAEEGKEEEEKEGGRGGAMPSFEDMAMADAAQLQAFSASHEEEEAPGGLLCDYNPVDDSGCGGADDDQPGWAACFSFDGNVSVH